MGISARFQGSGQARENYPRAKELSDVPDETLPQRRSIRCDPASGRDIGRADYPIGHSRRLRPGPVREISKRSMHATAVCPEGPHNMRINQPIGRSLQTRRRLGQPLSRAGSIALAALNPNAMRSAMRSIFFGTVAIALATAPSFASGAAQGPKPSRSTSWAGTDRPVISSAADLSTARHWEYRYGYDKHAAWRGHWVPVR